MNILTNNYLAVHKYMSSVASNPKLNLTEAQKKTFQEVLTETTKEMSQEYVKANALSTQNNAIWKSIGAIGMNSSGYGDLLMSGIYSSSGGNFFNPLYGLGQSLNPYTLLGNNRYNPLYGVSQPVNPYNYLSNPHSLF